MMIASIVFKTCMVNYQMWIIISCTLFQANLIQFSFSLSKTIISLFSLSVVK